MTSGGLEVHLRSNATDSAKTVPVAAGSRYWIGSVGGGAFDSVCVRCRQKSSGAGAFSFCRLYDWGLIDETAAMVVFPS